MASRRGAAFEHDLSLVGVAPVVAEAGREVPVEIQPLDGRTSGVCALGAVDRPVVRRAGVVAGEFERRAARRAHVVLDEVVVSVGDAHRVGRDVASALGCEDALVGQVGVPPHGGVPVRAAPIA